MTHAEMLKTADALETAGGVGAAGGLAFGAHKGLEAGANYLTRQNPVTRKYFDNYYADMSRSGFASGWTGGNTVLPRFRRAIMGQMPSVTGLTDYEVSRAMGTEAREHFKGLGEVAPENALQSVAPALHKVDPNEFKSPIVRNLARGAQQPASSPVASFLQRFSGPERQAASGFGKMVGDFATGTAMHGPVGGMAAVLGGFPDAAAYTAASQGKINTLMNLKSKVMNLGYQNKLKPAWQRLMSFADPSTAEFYHMGGDLRRIPGVEKIMGIRSPLTGVANQAIRQEATSALLGPGKKSLGSAIVKDFPRLAKWMKFL